MAKDKIRPAASKVGIRLESIVDLLLWNRESRTSRALQEMPDDSNGGYEERLALNND